MSLLKAFANFLLKLQLLGFVREYLDAHTFIIVYVLKASLPFATPRMAAVHLNFIS